METIDYGKIPDSWFGNHLDLERPLLHHGIELVFSILKDTSLPDQHLIPNTDPYNLGCLSNPYTYHLDHFGTFLHNLGSLTLPMLRLLWSQPQESKRFLKTTQTLSYWCSLESSRWALSDEYPIARVLVFFRFFAWFCIGQMSRQQHKG